MRRWVGAGLDPAAFWAITPREVLVILDGADARARADLKTAQQLAYSTAVLISIASHNPKKFPKFDKVFPDLDARQKVQTPDAIYAAMIGWADFAETTNLNMEIH